MIFFCLFIFGCSNTGNTVTHNNALTEITTSSSITTESPISIVTVEAITVSAIKEPSIDEKVENYISKMTIEEKIGQLLIIGIESNYDISVIDKLNPGGIILYKKNIKDKNSIIEFVKVLQERTKNKLFICIDHEGGVVNRLPPREFSYIPTAWDIKDKSDSELHQIGKTISDELNSIGVNLNFSPVLDMLNDPKKYVIGKRSYGDDPLNVTRVTSILIEEMNKKGIIPVAKHFPGYGMVIKDPHKQLSSTPISLEELVNKHVSPYIKIIENNIGVIMVAHVIYSSIDKYPATYSKVIINTLLRESMGYEGILVTDDMEMGAMQEKGEIGELALKAFLAGEDLLIVAQTIKAQQKVYNTLMKAYVNKEITDERLNTSLKRIIKKKFQNNIIN